jgi:UDP-2,4-diacetamido-2,4,6-trideoxy-beta-L-altropyranose hydrolase
MKIIIRVDASVKIGTGHVMRCLTLADALRGRGDEVFFVSRELPGNSCDLIAEKGFHVFRLSAEEIFDEVEDAEQAAMVLGSKPDWLIVDHYGIGVEWERRLRPQVGRIMVIDDLADRPHDCDILLDQNLFDDMQSRYNGLVPVDCCLFIGPRYALLRDEFIEARGKLRQRDGIVRSILLFFGGSDPTNETEKALSALRLLNFTDILIDVVVGESNPNAEKIKVLCRSLPNISFHLQVSNMAELIASTDLAIGAGGTATWERCFMGLPALIIIVADNQVKPAEAAHNAGLAWLIGKSDEVTVVSLATAIRKVLRQSEALLKMMNHSLNFMGQRKTPINAEIMNCLYEVPHES